MEFAKIIWNTDDLKTALQNRGIESTQKNIDTLLNDACFAQTLKQQSTAHGWEILDELISLHQKELIGDEPEVKTATLWTYGTRTKYLKFQVNDAWLEDIVATLGYVDSAEFSTDYSYYDSKKVFTLAENDTKSSLMILSEDDSDKH
ncbi:hypothetical protein MF621_004011 (plasmid) [Bacillus velezensis]|uniref:hypothetical protein n=1 Tax=Bacillus velezensis TaxID=492670 RepID=UPI00049F39EE|nr:hypothetical protein [Bacillus velezensis]KDN88927.1 hypothetical protein EF87_21760 [Bacillus amyloliquefaciens]URJ76470.1 hypothetical protein MF619_004049 [Bacillus velezensis]URJ80426.1 hypothetical protein MF621_004011 [Bacillus velezensis]